MSNNPLLIRVDAGVGNGTGHFMRCLALAEAWMLHAGPVTFACCPIPSTMGARLRQRGIDLLTIHEAPASRADAATTAQVAREFECVILDGYHFDGTFQRTVRSGAAVLGCIDDAGHAGAYCADVVVNQNRHAAAGLYPNRSSQTRLLLGTDYVLLRQEYTRLRGTHRGYSHDGARILVTFGGSDPANATLKVLETLRLLARQGLTVRVVIGAANTNAPAIAESASDLGAEVIYDTECMSQLIGWADVAISSAGTTVWEFLYMGTHALLGATVPVEELLLRGVADQQSLGNIGWYREVSSERLAEVIADAINRRPTGKVTIGGGLIDGCGAQRVVGALMKIGVFA